MDFEKVLNHRRSIRKYTDQPVSRNDIDKCLQAAILAPSWKNSQTPRFYVIQSPEVMADLKERALSEPNLTKIRNAPVLVVETFVPGQSGYGNDGAFANEGGDGWAWYDLGLATENFCLQADALGLGTLIMGIRDAQALKDLLEIPETETVGAVLALGHPDTDPKMPPRHDIEDCTRFF